MRTLIATTELTAIEMLEKDLAATERGLSDLEQRAFQLRNALGALGAGPKAVKAPQATNGHTKPAKPNGKAKPAQKAARAPRGGVQKAVLAASGEFGPEEIATANPGFSMATIRATIQRLHEKGQLKRVARGLYERVLVDG